MIYWWSSEVNGELDLTRTAYLLCLCINFCLQYSLELVARFATMLLFLEKTGNKFLSILRTRNFSWCLLLPSIALEVRRDRTLNIVGRRVSIFFVLCQLPNPGPWVKNTGLTFLGIGVINHQGSLRRKDSEMDKYSPIRWYMCGTATGCLLPRFPHVWNITDVSQAGGNIRHAANNTVINHAHE